MPNSRSKGKRGELEAAAEIRRLFGVEAFRGRQYHGGEDSPDIATGIPLVHFEVKRVEQLRLHAAMDQAIADAGEHRLPCILHKANRRPWLAIVRLDDLPDLAVQIYLTMAAQG